MIYYLVQGSARRIEGLCPICWTGSLWETTIYRLSDTMYGPTIDEHSTLTLCAPCRQPVAPV